MTRFRESGRVFWLKLARGSQLFLTAGTTDAPLLRIGILMVNNGKKTALKRFVQKEPRVLSHTLHWKAIKYPDQPWKEQPRVLGLFGSGQTRAERRVCQPRPATAEQSSVQKYDSRPRIDHTVALSIHPAFTFLPR